jgi:hypothetical protein
MKIGLNFHQILKCIIKQLRFHNFLKEKIALKISSVTNKKIFQIFCKSKKEQKKLRILGEPNYHVGEFCITVYTSDAESPANEGFWNDDHCDDDLVNIVCEMPAVPINRF